MKWFPLMAGLLSLIYGLFLFAYPLSSVATVAWIIALIIFASGVSSFVAYFANPDYRSRWQLVQSSLSIIFGLILLSSSVFSLTTAFMTIIAYWVLVSGILRLLTALRLRKTGYPRYAINYSGAVLTILFGLVLLGAPLFSASLIGIIVASFFVLVGLSLILLATRL